MLTDRRRTVRKIRMEKQKNFNQKRTSWYKAGWTDLWWEYVESVVKPKEFWKKNFRLEEASLFDFASHLRPYKSPSLNSPNRRALCANNIKLYYLKDCEILSMAANSFGIATNTGLAVINEEWNAMDVEFKWPGSAQCSGSKVFENSSICKRLHSSDLTKIFQTLSNNLVKIPNYLIGEAAYPSLPYYMKEYSIYKSNEDVVFDSMIIRSADNPIKCAFG